jgi:hypothetical protein
MMIDRTLVYALIAIVGVVAGLVGLGAWLF